MNQAHLNQFSSAVILEELVRYGVTDVCVAPGSRSTPLILQADAHSKITLHHHFDERGLGFLALGMCKATKKPVAIIVTSGTAVANLLPAVVEANLTGEKLILLTADRPPELIGCGANQAIQQQDIFSHHVTDSIFLDSPIAALPEQLNEISIQTLKKLNKALVNQETELGPIHINCPFPEPLYSEEPFVLTEYIEQSLELQDWYDRHQQIGSNSPFVRTEFQNLTPDFSNKRGIVVVGSVELEDAKAAREFANKLGWPIFCDPQSGVASQWQNYDLWLQHPVGQNTLLQSEIVIQFGPRVVSKRLLSLIKSVVSGNTHAEYFYIHPDWRKSNQDHLLQTHIHSSAQRWISFAVQNCEVNKHNLSYGWANELHSLSTLSKQVIDHISTVDVRLSETEFASKLHRITHGNPVFLGNSLFVRLVDMYGQLDEVEIYSNRGASGIDGLIATAAGIQSQIEKPLITVVGDTSLLYDLNSLALFTHLTKKSIIVVINNDGGAIFDMLPINQAKKQALYQRPHGMKFEASAAQFGLNYLCPKTWIELQSTIYAHQKTGTGTLLVEVLTPPSESTQHIRQIKSQIIDSHVINK